MADDTIFASQESRDRAVQMTEAMVSVAMRFDPTVAETMAAIVGVATFLVTMPEMPPEMRAELQKTFLSSAKDSFDVIDAVRNKPEVLQ